MTSAGTVRRADEEVGPEIPNVIHTTLSLYNSAVNLWGAAQTAKNFRVLSQTRLTGDMLADLEALYELDELLVAKLRLHATRYDCSYCHPGELKSTYRFERAGLGNVGTFETRNDDTCVLDLKTLVAVLRHVIQELEVKAYKLVAQLAQRRVSDDALLDTGGCDGPALGECFEEGQDRCVAACRANAGCAGVQLGGEGTRCCLLRKISTRSPDGPGCFVASRAELLALDAPGLQAWLRRKGFGPYEAASDANGLVLAALSRTKLTEYWEVPADEAARLKCAVDSALHGRGCTAASVASAALSTLDHLVFFGVKAVTMKGHPFWAATATTRILEWGKHWSGAKAMRTRLVDVLDAVFPLTHTDALRQQAIAEEVNPVIVVESLSYFLNRAAELKWDDCGAIMEALLRDDGLVKIDELVQAGVGQEPQ